VSLSATKYPAGATFGLLFGAAVWGVIWYPYRLLEQAGISGAAASAATYACALALGMVLLWRRPRTTLRIGRSFVLLALAAGWTNLSYVLAVIEGEVMRVMLLFYLAPLWTLLLARLLLGEKTGIRGLFVIALSLSGAFVMLWQPQQGLPMPSNTAEWLGLSSGMAFALTNVLTRRAVHLSLREKSFAVWVGATLLGLAFLSLDPSLRPSATAINGASWLMVAGIGGVLMLTTLLVQYGLTHTLATRAAVIFLFELVVASVTAYLLAGEAIGPREWIGGAMIVLASVFAPAAEAHRN
jgi:drug/metabolite transporter (DMT)-like permease